MLKRPPLKSRIFLILLLVSCSLSFHAQNSKNRISGTVVDSAEKKEISFATINLFKNGQNAQPLKSTYSDAKGKFGFSIADSGNYILAFSHSGFTEKKQQLKVSGSLDLGVIELSPVIVAMKAVNVLSQKPLVEQQEDKVIFNVENDPDSKTATTLDIFRKTPYLTVDGEDNVQLNGQSNFKVLLNGRETSMFARNVKEALRAFPGTLISKIEVMTTPPAKYDAEGVGGIINIITKKKVSGYNGSVSTFNRTGSKANNFSVNFNAKTGKFGFAFFYYLGGYNNQMSSAFAETLPKTSSFYTKRVTDEKTSNDNFYNGGNLEISFEIDSLNTISTYGNINGGNGSNLSERTITTDFPSSPSFISYQEIDNSYSFPSYNVGFDYIRKFKKDKNGEFSMRFYKESGRNTGSDNSWQDNPGTDRYLLNKSKNKDNQWTIQSDLIKPLPKNRKIESGMKFISRDAFSNYQSSVKYNPSDNFMIDPNNSDYFNYTQSVFSAYSTYSFKDKKSTYRIGSRLEFTSVDGNFVSSSTTVRQRYANLIPYFQSIKKLNATYTLVLTYTQRLRRPYIWNLNPFVNNIDSLNISYGNPELGPEAVHFFTYEIRYQKKATFIGLGLQILYSKNYITNYSSFEPSTGITKTTSDHLGRGTQERLNLNLNSKLNSKLNIYFNGSIQYDFNKVKGHTEYTSEGIGGYFNTGYTYTISKKISWSGNFSLNKSPRLIQYKYPTNIWYVTVLSFKLFKEKVNMSVRTTNFLKKDFDYRMIIDDPYFKTTRVTTRPLRGFVLTFNWNFGKLKENVSRKKGISNDDLMNKGDGN